MTNSFKEKKFSLRAHASSHYSNSCCPCNEVTNSQSLTSDMVDLLAIIARACSVCLIQCLGNFPATQLTSSSGNGADCPNDPVVFTCTVTGRNSLLWRINVVNVVVPNDMESVAVTRSDGIGPLPVIEFEGFMFQPAITANDSDSLTSTLTTLTEVSSLNGTTVTCSGNAVETLNITVAGELLISITLY